MNEYYVFDIKNDFYKLYKNKASELYYIYNRIYHMKKSDKEYGYNLFCQISNFFNKKVINDTLKEIHKEKIMYSINANEHIINDLFKNEISILTVKNSNVRIESNTTNPTFFDDLKNLNMNLFVCDFKHNDYFFISRKGLKII